MMRILLFIVFGSIISLASAQQIDKQISAFDSAVKLLSTTDPQNLLDAKLAPDPNDRKFREKLFSDQMVAIITIGKANKKVDLDILLPFLSMTTDLSYGVVKIGDRRPRQFAADMDQRRAKFPVFGLILDMPDSADALEKYVEDNKKPLNLRLNACIILGYFETERLNKAAEQLASDVRSDSSIKQQKRILEFIEAIKNRKVGYGFDGGVDFQ